MHQHGRLQLLARAAQSLTSWSVRCVLGMASHSEIETQVESLKRKKAELKVQLRTAHQQAKVATGSHHVAQILRKAGADEVIPSLLKSTETQLLFLMEVSDCCADIPTSWALGQGRKAPCRAHGLDVWETQVRQNISAGVGLLYTGVAYDSVVEILNGDPGQMVALSKYAIEYKLFHWLVELNCNKGVNPGTSQLVVRACQYLPAKAPGFIRDKLKAFFMEGGRSVRRWVSSFKKRWCIKEGLLQAGEELEAGVLSDKASWLSFFLWGNTFFWFWRSLFWGS